MGPQPSLWARSAAWRWLIAGAAMCTMVAFIGVPWRAPSQQQAAPQAKFDPSRVAAVRTTGTPPQLPQTPAASSASNQTPPAAAYVQPVLGTTRAPQARSGVAWSNQSGSVTGGGLIAAYCCAGAYSSVFADTPVRSGRHYWELTLSVRPGAQQPDTWTTAGVTTVGVTKGGNARHVPPPRPRGGDGSAATVIGWGQGKQYRNGDTLMLALDADSGTFYYGVNGQWINGQPGAAGGERLSPGGAGFVPYVNVSASSGAPESDRWIANFGGTPFRYPPPAGFSSYGTTAPVASASVVPVSQSSAAAQQLAARGPTIVNSIFEDQITIGGRNVPLPEGKWLGLAFFRGNPGTTSGDTAVLGRVVSGRLAGMVAITAFQQAGGNGFPPYHSCDRQDYVYISKTENTPFGTQRCWWINHAVRIWDQEPIAKAAATVLAERGISRPEVLVNLGYRRADRAGFVTMLHYHVPDDPALQGTDANWAESDWHRDRISLHPARAAYVENLRKSAQGWESVFAAYR